MVEAKTDSRQPAWFDETWGPAELVGPLTDPRTLLVSTRIALERLLAEHRTEATPVLIVVRFDVTDADQGQLLRSPVKEIADGLRDDLAHRLGLPAADVAVTFSLASPSCWGPPPPVERRSLKVGLKRVRPGESLADLVAEYDKGRRWRP